MDLEFYYDVASPPSYIAHERLPGILERTGATLTLRPVLAGGVFKLSGNASPLAVPAKRNYMMRVELPRLSRTYGIKLDFHPEAPFESLPLMRGAMIAEQTGRLAEYTTALFRAMWAEACDMSDPAVVAEVLDNAGFDSKMIFARMQQQTTKDQLLAATEAAASRGAFGVPTFFIGTEIFFGQDRLDTIEAALSARISAE